MSEPLLLVKLTATREWASEQSADIRDTVLTLCDALEDCAVAHHEALEAKRELLASVAALRAEVERMIAGMDGDAP